MKRALPAVAGLLLAVSLLLLTLAWREIGTLRDEVAELRKEREVRKLQAFPAKDAVVTKFRNSSNEAKKDPPEDKDARKDKDSSSGLDLLMGAGKSQIEKRKGARIALLTQRLNLRPDQLKGLEKHASEYSEKVAAAFERMNNNTARPPDMGVLSDWMSGRFDLPVKDLLDAEQTKQFAKFDAEDRANRIENLVNMELTELHGQGSIQLSSEQKDKLFEALTGILSAEDAMGDAYYTDDAGFSARLDASLARRREALQAILDASQLENYDRVLAEDRATIMKTFPPSEESPPAR
jgi:hypothetical protein